MSVVSPRRRVLLWALFIFVGAILLLLVVPMIQKHLVQGQMTGTLNNARQLQIAMQMMALDSADIGENKRSALPADLGVKSKAEYLARLTRDNYLSAADVAKISQGLDIVNVASTDPPDTAWVVSDGALHSERAQGKGFVVFTMGGSGGVYRRAADGKNPSVIKLPNRQPQILPDE